MTLVLSVKDDRHKKMATAFPEVCYRSRYFDVNRPLAVGVKPYLPGQTISRDHSFVKSLDKWSDTDGKTPKSEMTPPMIRNHPGNPIAVIEGSDNIDYVLTDKNEGGKHFADKRARQLAKDLLWDLGEGLAETGSGLPPNYFQDVIMLPTDGTKTQYKYDVTDYYDAYSRQSGVKIAKAQLAKDIGGTDLKGVVKEIMMSDMMIGTIRQKIGYYELSTNERFENVTNKTLGYLLHADGNHLNGTDDISMSPLFIKKIRSPKFQHKNNGSVITTSFDYGFGKLFKESNMRTTEFICRPSKFRKSSDVKFLRRVGFTCQSFMSVGGTYFLQSENELTEREEILRDNQEYHIERMTKAGITPFEKRKIFPTGHSNLTFTRGGKDSTSKVARFLLFMKTTLDHRTVFPFVLALEMIKSELVTLLTLISIIFHQLTNPQSNQFEPSEMIPGEATIMVYQRLVETLFPCSSWWNSGTIKSGERWKMSTLSLFSRNVTTLAPAMYKVERALDIENTDERTRTKMGHIKKVLEENTQSRYMFFPVIESNSLVFTADDSAFCTNNCANILPENKVKELFDLRNERSKGPLQRSVVSAVVSLGAFEKAGDGEKKSRLTAELQQPTLQLSKAETIRIFCFPKNDVGEDEPEYDVKIKGYLQSLRIFARRDQTVLSVDNIHGYLQRLGVLEKEQADVIRLFEDEVAAEESYEQDEGDDFKRQDGESSPKRAKLCVNEQSLE